MEAVTDILAERMRQPRGMNRTVVVSLLAHAVLLTAFFAADLARAAARDASANVMTISLGGAPGPRAGGMTPMGGRPVQAPPAEEAPRRGAGDAAGREDAGDDAAVRADASDAAEDAGEDSAARKRRRGRRRAGAEPQEGSAVARNRRARCRASA